MGKQTIFLFWFSLHRRQIMITNLPFCKASRIIPLKTPISNHHSIPWVILQRIPRYISGSIFWVISWTSRDIFPVIFYEAFMEKNSWSIPLSISPQSITRSSMTGDSLWITQKFYTISFSRNTSKWLLLYNLSINHLPTHL